MEIGYRIRKLRNRYRITLKTLAKKTGLTTSFLSQLERDLTSPSISSLEKIAAALNTKAGYFFEREERRELVFIKRGTDKRFIDKEKKIFSETLAPGLFNIKMQPQILTIGINARLTGELISPEEERFVMVLKGKVELLCNSERFILKEGDSIYCAYTQKLRKIANIGKTEAKLLWVVFAAL